MANRVMKQKNEKGKKQARDASEARKYGVRDTASYRKEMLHNTERPSKEEREKDSAAASEHFEKIAKDPGKVLGGRAQATRLEKVNGKVVNKPTGKLAAGRDQASVDIETSLVKKEYVSGVNKRNAKRDEAASKVDLTPEQKAGRIASRSEAASKAKAANAAKPVGKLPEAQTDRPSTRPLKIKKVNGKTTSTGGAQLIPGEGSAGILNPGNVARTAGTLSQGTRRRIERKAAYNAKKAGATTGYSEAAKLGTRTATAINTKNAAITKKLDSIARTRAASKDARDDAFKRSILKEAEKMPEGPAKSEVVRSGESIIQAPKKGTKTLKSGTVIPGTRDGMTEVTSRGDDRDITKSYTRPRPVGKGRMTDKVAALGNEKLKMGQKGEIEIQPDRPKATPIGVLGSHEDRLHALTKMFQVPAGEGKTHDLEPVHLRSYLKHKSANANVKFNEQDVVGAVFKAKHAAPETFAKIHKEVLEHRTKRIGQTNEQREKASSKAKSMRSMTAADRGGKRQASKAKRVVSNVQKRFTEVPNGGQEA